MTATADAVHAQISTSIIKQLSISTACKSCLHKDDPKNPNSTVEIEPVTFSKIMSLRPQSTQKTKRQRNNATVCCGGIHFYKFSGVASLPRIEVPS